MAADHLGCEVGLRTDRSQHGVPLPTQGNEDEEHSPAVADSHSTPLVAPVPDSCPVSCRTSSSGTPTATRREKTCDANRDNETQVADPLTVDMVKNISTGNPY